MLAVSVFTKTVHIGDRPAFPDGIAAVATQCHSFFGCYEVEEKMHELVFQDTGRGVV
jgi:hypothetical protein